MDTDTPSIWNKPSAEITVKDSLKMQAVILAVMAGGAVVILGGASAVAAVQSKLQARKDRKQNETTENES